MCVCVYIHIYKEHPQNYLHPFLLKLNFFPLANKRINLNVR